jgi:anti-sigma-K factor RskA
MRPEDMRAGDADREQVLDRLHTAQAEGRLDVGELEERVAATLVARTYGELAELTADLPGEPPSPRPLAVPAQRAPAAARADRHAPERRGSELRAAAATWAGVSVTVIAVWVVIGIASGSVGFPWWIWVAGPWGLGLLWSWTQVRRHGH